VLLNGLLELGDEASIFLAEESLQDLLDLPVTIQILEEGLDVVDYIEIQGFGSALRLLEPTDFWLLLTDRYCQNKIVLEQTKKWSAKKSKTAHVDDFDFFLALAEYYSKSLAGELFCESCNITGAPIYINERIDRLAFFLKSKISLEESILEICCGNGMATQALFRQGHNPLSMDSDRCDLCQALKSGLMCPEKSFILDARLLPKFLSPQSFHTVLGFMVGMIDESNWPLWKDILLKASSLATEQILFTVYTKKEAEVIAKAFGKAGWVGNVIDNRDSKGIYDQWAYLATRDE
jgi:hypothetical protein